MTVRSVTVDVRAARVIVAVPIAIAGQISYEPMLPADRSFLHQRMPSGSVLKCHALYDGPFWRNEGPTARKLSAMDPADRKAAIIEALVPRFGPKAKSPFDFTQQNRTTERYSGGGMISHAPPGVLTESGHALRAACGRIHWAGAETSSVMLGFVDGAIRSGERAADEALEAQAASQLAPV